MLKFVVHDPDAVAPGGQLQHAHLLGNDDVGVAGKIAYDPETRLITCEKRSAEAAALALMMDAGPQGRLILQTCLLPDREEPYPLLIELARQRIKAFLVKLEDWMLFDLEADHPIMALWNRALQVFTDALILQSTNPAGAEALARQAIETAIAAGEKLTILHADLLLARRGAEGRIPRRALGCTVHQSQFAEPLARIVRDTFDYISIPVRWREVEPEEGEYDWTRFDRWMNWARATKCPVVMGPLIDFRQKSVPEWLYIWEHDYDTTHDLLYEHIEAIVSRYKDAVWRWNVASSLHINQNFTLSYDQLLDVTRMATSLVRSLHPSGEIMIEITEPFGEYYHHNAKSIPPVIYAETLAQSGYKIDCLGVVVEQGDPRTGRGTRDLMQLSALLDRFLYLERPIVVSGLAAPSGRPAMEGPDAAGYWRDPWSPTHQSEWLTKMIAIAMSKPFVQSVVIEELYDHATSETPGSGLITSNGRPKPSLVKMANLHRDLHRGALRCSTPEERDWGDHDLPIRTASIQ